MSSFDKGHNQPDDNLLAKLNSPNLRQLNASAGDKDRTQALRSYLDSQAKLRTTYALEGKEVVASWDFVDEDSTSKKPGPLRDVELESGFRTPILKPRSLTASKHRERQLKLSTDMMDSGGSPPSEGSPKERGRRTARVKSVKATRDAVDIRRPHCARQEGVDHDSRNRVKQGQPSTRTRPLLKRKKESSQAISSISEKSADTDEERRISEYQSCHSIPA